ncbi:RagB/SusD family nutrient uptake outer membrane protein [Flaviramulus sp. BrNp1-15]|uniref:RagB/SusD family nutrient uptake outer membrane protein n=1 Tax=Flaviramulus sp. BrNp1-15 TaxID=2916754 RepID=UPI001EE81681|nr:RagB/SusD family nutrient uptake outer membrane protein [Flaviramulus sp. BrNp1-15]ULC59488.1 RagB/SusD family nutrient uptake outer membrane protein [Flaviramulus sp. BrNp1-15]
MKNIFIKLFMLMVITIFCSCNLDEIENPNAPTVSSFANGASQADIQLLATGVEAVMRNDLAFHYDTVSILGREYYDLTGVDPRYTGELLKGPLDNNGFLTTRSYAAWYKVVKSANVLIEAVENSAAGFTDEIKNSYYGYAKTLKAYALLMLANRQYSNGIRLDVADPDNLGPNVDYTTALTGIMDILNDANTDLANSSPEFDFSISNGFSGFNTTASFSEFNRAIAARVALYQDNNSMALSLLSNSFFDMNGDLYNGVAHVFGLTGNDILNTQYHVPGQSGQEFMIHNSWINDAEAGDARVADKSFQLTGGTSFDGLSADYQIAIYDSNTDPVYLIRNEELILIYAEANIGSNNPEAIEAINVVRNASGLIDYSGGVTDDDLIEEVLNQRRYSLLGEGHRWIDLRRLNKLDATYIPLDRAGDNIIDAFPTPFSENIN